MLKKIRRIIAIIVFASATMLFLDYTGTIHLWLGWLAKVQLIPAILATNIIVLIILTLITLLFGRIYCSVICPLGIMQDAISHLSGKRKGKKNRFRFSKAKSWLRYAVIALSVVAFLSGFSVIISLLDPYAAYGRTASNLLAPVYCIGNNLAAWFTEKIDSYSLYSTGVWVKNWITFGIAALTLSTVGFLSWRGGRTYCNTICFVGTALGFISRFSLFKPSIDTEKCIKCKACERNCKSSCIDAKNMTIDHSRCVTCFNCIDKCKFGAIKYTLALPDNKIKVLETVPVPAKENKTGLSRRSFFAISSMLVVTNILKARMPRTDSGLAVIEDIKVPNRQTPIVPPGAKSLRNLTQYCSACQLCISACPNNILRPSGKLSTLMQPEISFDNGYCHPECTKCSQVCPAGAITKITKADKSTIAIGQAMWIKDNCVVNRYDVQCNNCQKHCPNDAITFVHREPGNKESLMIPVIDKERCIGCGACEYQCSARPLSAIYVEGNLIHHTV